MSEAQLLGRRQQYSVGPKIKTSSILPNIFFVFSYEGNLQAFFGPFQSDSSAKSVRRQEVAQCTAAQIVCEFQTSMSAECFGPSQPDSTLKSADILLCPSQLDSIVRADRKPEDPKCPAGHFLFEFNAPDGQWACDLCKERQVRLDFR